MQPNNLVIDIEKVIGSKSPKLLKALPRFIIRYIKRIIHQDEINSFLALEGHRKDVDFADAVLNFMQVNYRVEGLENLDDDKRYLFASNHPLGGTKYPEIKFPVNDLLMNITPLHGIFIPVNKHGAQLSQNAQILEQAYSSGGQVLYFPAGLCSRKQNGRIEDLEWKKSFIVKSVKHQRDIVPIYFSGKNSSFFYNLSRIRGFLGIKANIEMLYLVDEMFKQKGKDITVTIGKPISYSTFDNSKTPQYWAKWVKEQVYLMSSNNK